MAKSFKLFEKTKADKNEPRGMKEGSKKEEAIDKREAKSKPKGNPSKKP